MKYCFLDMDGVLADFVTGICTASGRPNPYTTPAARGVFDMEKLWGITAEEFWRDTLADGFWEGLGKTEFADELVEMVLQRFSVEQVCILTSPSMAANCIPEKRAWVRKYYPQLAGNMLLGAAKHFLAGPDRMLLDDRDKNIENFDAYGGVGITVPQVWNKEWRFSDNTMGRLETVFWEA